MDSVSSSFLPRLQKFPTRRLPVCDFDIQLYSIIGLVASIFSIKEGLDIIKNYNFVFFFTLPVFAFQSFRDFFFSFTGSIRLEGFELLIQVVCFILY